MFENSLSEIRSNNEGIASLPQTSWDEILNYFDIQYRTRSTGVIRLSCIVHVERTPSLVCWPESGLFYCFGCGHHGNKFDFIALLGSAYRSRQIQEKEFDSDARLNKIMCAIGFDKFSRIMAESDDKFEDDIPF